MQTQTPEPLVYTERLPQVERTFRLYRDRVEIDARWTVGRSFQTTVRLADLSLKAVRFTVRNKWFKKSVLVAAIAIGLALFVGRTETLRAVHWVSYPCWPVAGVAALIALRSFPNRQFVHFPRKDGKPGLDICKTDADRFETFVGEIQARISRR